jgi:hypothetical protein
MTFSVSLSAVSMVMPTTAAGRWSQGGAPRPSKGETPPALEDDDFEKLLCEILPDVILYMRPDYVPGKDYNMELPRLAQEAIQADKKRALAQ